MHYSNKKFTWGFELEIGDLDRALTIPPNLGKWEYSETDVVNVNPGPYQYRACDPLGLEPPLGGEINTRPTKRWSDQLNIIDSILNWAKGKGQSPSSNCISHTHIHVHVPGLTEDPQALKRLADYTYHNQADVIKHCHQFDVTKLGKSSLGKTYLKWDGGRPMPQYINDNIQKHAHTFDDFIRLFCCGKDAVSRGRPYRYAVNLYSLKHTQTVEFRVFRHSLSLEQIGECFAFAEQYLLSALNQGPNVATLLQQREYGFPEFQYHFKTVEGWLRTKWPTERGKKCREFVRV